MILAIGVARSGSREKGGRGTARATGQCAKMVLMANCQHHVSTAVQDTPTTILRPVMFIELLRLVRKQNLVSGAELM
ncbi:hypothetical protein SAMN05428953_101189 [Mesorhizobium muleiense]|uniref:Uncharacterized protein n=1 Tax=Mesorhizobium muleiense TaxID=1004279 RepID=A0A1G8HWT3_9HYPH|nr:hypothetical protein SAMN05428953_101189 [Mesorhizobium muleiense]